MKTFESGPTTVRRRNRLPHWDSPNALYFVTWNLVDAIPPHVREGLQHEYEFALRHIRSMRGVVTAADRAAVSQDIRSKIEKVLDQSHGECDLRDPICATIVAESIQYFDGIRYRLCAWSVMPNHVHVVFSCEGTCSIDAVVGAWKGFTSKEIGRVLRRPGVVWQEDYFDRTIRNDRQFQRTIAYVLNNPSTAGLDNWPFVRAYPERLAMIV